MANIQVVTRRVEVLHMEKQHLCILVLEDAFREETRPAMGGCDCKGSRAIPEMPGNTEVSATSVISRSLDKRSKPKR